MCSQENSSSPANPANKDNPAWYQSDLLAGFALILIVAAAYIPAFSAGYIWDDSAHLTDNHTVKSPYGLRSIWLDPMANSQYYPIVFTSFWLEYRLWEDHPTGYHVTNILLHGLICVGIWVLLSRWKLPGAWFAAAVFGLHPVHVESVAWVSERKDVLSGLFFVLTLLAWDKFQRTRKIRSYVAAFILFALALGSKTAVCPLPLLLPILSWWRSGRTQFRDWILTLPLLALSICAGLVTIYVEQFNLGTMKDDLDFSFLERTLIVGRTLWFYVWKLVWPLELMTIYPRWEIDPHSVRQWIFPILALALPLVLWIARGRFGRGPFTAIAFFGLMAGPTLGFFSLSTYVYSFVFDHYQYLASIGPIVLMSTLLTVILRRVSIPGKGASLAMIPVLLILGSLTWKQCTYYKDQETLFRYNVSKNPSAWFAYNVIASSLLERGRYEEAMSNLQKSLNLNPGFAKTYDILAVYHLKKNDPLRAIQLYRQALEIDPEDPIARRNLSNLLLAEGNLEEALAECRKLVERWPRHPPFLVSLGNVCLSAGNSSEALVHYRNAISRDPGYAPAYSSIGNLMLAQNNDREAAKNYRKALHYEPDMWQAAINLAGILSTNRDAGIYDPEEAVRLAERACAETVRKNGIYMTSLAVAYRAADREAEALAAAAEALDLARADGDIALEKELIRRLQPFGLLGDWKPKSID